MSHWETVETKMSDVELLRAACQHMSLELIERGVARGYGTKRIESEYVIKLSGRYDIAVNRATDGTLGLTTDWWGGDVAKQVGEKYSLLQEEYNLQGVMAQANAAGKVCERGVTSDGKLHLRVYA